MNHVDPLDRIRVVLCATTHPGNIGAAARAMKTMGLTQLYLVNPRYFPHPEATARAAGAADILTRAKIYANLDMALRGTVMAIGCSARKRDLSHPAISFEEAAASVMSQPLNQNVAVVFGTEMSGLTTQELDKCQMLAYIPANPEYSSLNLAAAVQVMTYELRRALPHAKGDTSKKYQRASFEEMELFYRHLEQKMIETGFLDPLKPKRLMQRMRRIFARAQLEKQEVNILRGFLKAGDKR